MAKKVTRQTTKKSTKKAARKTAKKVTKKATKKAISKKTSSKRTSTKATAVSPGLSVGDRVPKFSLPATGGGVRTEKDLKGQRTVLYFYPKDNTSGCTLQGQNFRDRHKDFQRLGVQVIGVSPDSLRSHENFKSKESFPFDLISDEEKTLSQAFGVWKEKSMYGRKYFGVERSTFVIDEQGRVIQEWRKVKVPGHVDEVYNFLK